jgi:predicted O-methyltransferase YrrM
MLGRSFERLPRPRFLRRIHLVWFYRAFARKKPRAALRYALRGRETSNFTYDISNREELAALAAGTLSRDVSEVLQLFAEIEGDEPLLDALGASLRGRRDRNQRPMLGRRIVWYAAARVARPRIAVETGTHDGLGSSVIARALQRNEEEGDPGRLLTFDIDPETGWLIPAQVLSHVERHLGDVRETLAAAIAGRPVGLFVHDSRHTYEHELFELRTIMAAAVPGIVLISDNAHASHALADFAREQNASFQFAPEIPIDHFYPGGGVGIAVVR